MMKGTHGKEKEGGGRLSKGGGKSVRMVSGGGKERAERGWRDTELGDGGTLRVGK